MTKRWWAAAGLVLVMAVGSPLLAANNDPLAGLSLTPIELPELHEGAFVARDVDGIPHIVARNAHDVYFIAGFIQARDRLFQMDLARRQASGTLAEVLGPAVLGRDVELRTLGLRRAAERSLPVILDESRAALDAFAAGVNAYVAHHGLPLEYTLLGLTQFEPWTALDSMTVAKGAAFSLSFDLDIAPTQALMAYQQTGAAAGFDGVALFFADVYRSAPFEKWATVPEAGGSGTHQGLGTGGDAESRGPEVAPGVTPAALALGARYLERVRGHPAAPEGARPLAPG